MNKVITFPDMTEKKNAKKELNDTSRQRPLELPQYLWDLIDEDAERCGRSAVKQIRQILLIYFGLDTDINKSSVARVRALLTSKESFDKKVS